uniref:Serine protease n=1 Tax=Chromera velia CCMP2878 TaxID=1169474 RepID=A0A0G4FB53_9ALVE|eukprot:Cvel_16103.t1-p1 / transcript=Cvel_16103.t1 / gene=Cvel_16103 / organism=Chromera_velia_CCMP2878 / gene_product=hypothetical protein / transcript_product=hypothetical protein / location=Cvel_scaffold1225:27019-29880(-) / protein_length=671 / sequence_SO=supercontig / SO=protein_coding / is_pseudo=false
MRLSILLPLIHCVAFSRGTTAFPGPTGTLLQSNRTVAPDDSSKMVWHQDNRQNPTEATPSLRSTVALIRKGRARVVNGFLVPNSERMAQRQNYCDSVRFRFEPVPASCTGVLVDDDIVATAGHCVGSGTWSAYYYVFGFNTAERSNILSIPMSEVYEASALIGANYGTGTRRSDWALVRLSRSVSDREAVETRRMGRVAAQHFFVIGHPNGLPAKTTRRRSGLDSLSMMLNNGPSAYFEARLDTFGGNSGSPVFNAMTEQLEGLLVRGDSDWVRAWSRGRSCIRESNCPRDRGTRGLDRGIIRCEGEGVVRATEFAGALDRARKMKDVEARMTSKYDVEPIEGKSLFPVGVTGDDSSASVRIRFPSWDALSRAKATGPDGGEALARVDLSVEAYHSVSTCEMTAALLSPSGNSIDLGSLCSPTVSLDAHVLALALPPPASVCEPSNNKKEASEIPENEQTPTCTDTRPWVVEIRDRQKRGDTTVMSASLSLIFAPAKEWKTTVQPLQMIRASTTQQTETGEGQSFPSFSSRAAGVSLEFSLKEGELNTDSSGSPHKEQMVTDWSLFLSVRLPGELPSSFDPLMVEVESGQGDRGENGDGGRRRTFTVSHHQEDPTGEVSVNLGGSLSEEERVFFYGVSPHGVWKVRLFRETGRELGPVEKPSMTLMVAERQ